MDVFKQALTSQSYAVQGAALNAIALLDPAQALTAAKAFEKDNKGALTVAMVSVYAANGGSAQWPFVYKQFTDAAVQAKINLLRGFSAMTGRVENSAYAIQGIAQITEIGIKYKPNGAAPVVIGLLTTIKEQRAKLNDEAGAKAADDGIKAINDAK
jgi:aminopeptidase N